MNRRNLLSALGALPFMGWLGSKANASGLRIKSLPHVGPVGDGVALNSRAHPYAVAGEIVTCENGHPICEFIETVESGQRQDLPRQLGKWRQPEPEVGTIPVPVCAVCGAQFYTGAHFHIGESWRDPAGTIKLWRKYE